MDTLRILMILALCVFLAEGFVLAIFPQQFKRFMEEAEPRWLQWMGLVETVFALGLIMGILFG